MAALSEECGQSRNWLKTAKDPERGTRSIDYDVEQKLAALCRFDTAWPEWREGTAEAFQNRFLAADLTENEGLRERVADVRLKAGPTESNGLEGKERLASLLLGFMQAPPGEAWPVTLQIRCQNDTIDQFEIAVKRGWLQIDAGLHCEIDVGEVKGFEIEGSEGIVFVSAPGGTKSRTTWDIVARGKFIGLVDLPETFCSLVKAAPRDTIVARFAAFVKDLENITPTDDAVPTDCDPVNDSLSWRRLGYHTPGAAKQAIMMRVAQLKHLPGADRGWVVLCEVRRTFNIES